MTYNEFYNSFNLSNNIKKRDLKTYLLALLKLVEQVRQKPLTSDLLSKILKDAYTSEPTKFDNEWLKIVKVPDPKAIYSIFEGKAKYASEDLGIYYTLAVIKFQIAELHKMKGKQLEDEWRYFGIDSETGNRWYNFDPDSILECGMRCYLDHGDDESNNEEFEVSWQTLGDLLEMGRIYE
ncbi:hypothetical protein [Chryseobacterium gambrini]|uniref:Uncharacterized protein n=1 Tax=Chryseobacterium gambrini TaxID=373672 RepID=A0A1N7LJH3_9FLAO|nr:hypothetical protein [Chryseobacterium gambrini]SIS73998.1 hypothetical protein SAMN05421785_102281 [Chryseobacterium gambrini]